MRYGGIGAEKNPRRPCRARRLLVSSLVVLVVVQVALVQVETVRAVIVAEHKFKLQAGRLSGGPGGRCREAHVC